MTEDSSPLARETLHGTDAGWMTDGWVLVDECLVGGELVVGFWVKE